jgi:hypothetical protein
MGAIFAGTWFYDGQAFVVNSKKNPKVKKLADLNKASVCVETGTTTERNLADYARANKLAFKPVVFEGQEATEKAFQAGPLRRLHRPTPRASPPCWSTCRQGRLQRAARADLEGAAGSDAASQ